MCEVGWREREGGERGREGELNGKEGGREVWMCQSGGREEDAEMDYWKERRAIAVLLGTGSEAVYYCDGMVSLSCSAGRSQSLFEQLSVLE